jgi:hypothetical protein
LRQIQLSSGCAQCLGVLFCVCRVKTGCGMCHQEKLNYR